MIGAAQVILPQTSRLLMLLGISQGFHLEVIILARELMARISLWPSWH